MGYITLAMSRLSRFFPRNRVFLPVIHAVSADQALRNARIAHDNGADGVFVINHEMDGGRPLDYRALLAIRASISAALPGFWVGVNCLDLSAAEVFTAVDNTVSGVWTDNAHIDDADSELRAAKTVDERRQNYAGLYFGGVAFKYQAPVADEAVTASRAREHMDVVTTSGAATGSPADMAKIHRMKAALGDFPLGIASGITPENVAGYLPYVSCFLVATGISSSFTELEPTRVRLLADTIRAAG